MADGVVEKVTVSLEVPKEQHEVWAALAEVVAQTRKATADGFQAAEDLSAITLGSLQKLSAALGGLGELPEEYQLELASSLEGMGVGSGMVAKEIALVVQQAKPKDAPSEPAPE